MQLPSRRNEQLAPQKRVRPDLTIPAAIERAIGGSVARHLRGELNARGLLLPPGRLGIAESEAALLGGRLLTLLVRQCYPIGDQRDEDITIEFEREHDASRVNHALAFGAATAAVLQPRRRECERQERSVELLCAIFNLGIGLVDGLCDGEPDAGGRLLLLFHGRDLLDAAEEMPARGWLREKLAPLLDVDFGLSFTVDVIEAFFRTLHAAYPGDEYLALRRHVGTQLTAALKAERESVGAWPAGDRREQRIECSRRTSVLPFEILQTLAGSDDLHAAHDNPSAGRLLGEAMWRIDDLVDLCQDARSGALNACLLTAGGDPGRPEADLSSLAALEQMLHSTDIATVAADAADCLMGGLRLTRGDCPTAEHLSFLHYIQRYAAITYDETS
jgi:hypothetical protein